MCVGGSLFARACVCTCVCACDRVPEEPAQTCSSTDESTNSDNNHNEITLSACTNISVQYDEHGPHSLVHIIHAHFQPQFNLAAEERGEGYQYGEVAARAQATTVDGRLDFASPAPLRRRAGMGVSSLFWRVVIRISVQKLRVRAKLWARIKGWIRSG